MIVNKKLIILWGFCIALIALALSIKIAELPKESQDVVAQKTIVNENIEPSNSFYIDESQDQILEPAKIISEKPPSPISAKAYLVGNIETGEIYIKKNNQLVLPVASVSKLITAIESIDQFSLSSSIVIDESELVLPDAHKFYVGEKFTVKELLYPLLLNSSNIIAEALASSSNRSKFMDLMSSYAWEIGMPATYFADPSGISPLNRSSANDFFALARYLYKLRPDILAITKIPKITIASTTDHGYHEFVSTHPFVYDPNFLGGKTGRTKEARDTMLTIMSIKGKSIAIIVLASEDRRKDTLYLIDQIKNLVN